MSGSGRPDHGGQDGDWRRPSRSRPPRHESPPRDHRRGDGGRGARSRPGSDGAREQSGHNERFPRRDGTPHRDGTRSTGREPQDRRADRQDRRPAGGGHHKEQSRRRPPHKHAKPEYSLHVSGYPLEATEADLTEALRAAGLHPSRVSLPRDRSHHSKPKGFAFAQFRTEQEALGALDVPVYIGSSEVRKVLSAATSNNLTKRRRTVRDSPAEAASQSQPALTVAVYFGTFDPLHENHIALAKHCLAEGPADGGGKGARAAVDRVVFVPNESSPFKPFCSDTSDRLAMLAARFADEPRLSFFRLRSWDKTDWLGRGLICDAVAEREAASAEGRPVRVVQLMGQDSFERPTAQKALANADLYRNLGRELWILPREGSPEVRVPKHLDSVVRVLADYSDPRPLSSSLIRAHCHTSSGPPPDGWLHPSVWEEAQARGLYRSLRPDCCLIFLAGGPGSGKTTLGTYLAREHGYTHLSSGDFYRAGAELGVPAFDDYNGHLKGKLWADWLSAYGRACLQRAVEASGNNRFVVELGQLARLVASERNLGMASDLVVHLDCPPKEMVRRMDARGRDPPEKNASRAQKYHKTRDVELKLLTSCGKDGDQGGRVALCVDASGAIPFDEMAKKVSVAVAAVESRRPLDAPVDASRVTKVAPGDVAAYVCEHSTWEPSLTEAVHRQRAWDESHTPSATRRPGPAPDRHAALPTPELVAKHYNETPVQGFRQRSRGGIVALKK